MKHLGYSRIIKARDLRVLARYTAIAACIKAGSKEQQCIHLYWQKRKLA
ncbi:hypothetical protein [Pectinatus cerevisiiphilus]|uniref:Uncharacterized protein n=1 Tax=Pectinatus cerevisiiphilus TaxID=86956 RepID=A0A4R3K379_9FIRM|nr:hypothetical protein [Pectinatus cerevisiiphilus]TCS77140.1 hypothetical protein EDC37_1188 [Pectinatus cerevisiiphilus]